MVYFSQIWRMRLVDISAGGRYIDAIVSGIAASLTSGGGLRGGRLPARSLKKDFKKQRLMRYFKVFVTM